MRALNRDLLQLRRWAGGDGSHATRRDHSYALGAAADTLHELGFRGLRPIRETVFGRDAGHKRSDDHVTRAFDAMDRGPGIDGEGHHEQRIERESGERRGGKSRERSARRERAGQDSGRADREHDRGPGGAGGSGRESEHEKAAEPKPKTPDVDLGRRRSAARVRAGLRDGSVPVNAEGGLLHDIADETYVVAPARFEAFVAGRDLAAATVRSRVVRLPALTARAGAE